MSKQDRLEWSEIGNTEADCFQELEGLYWKALEAELADGLLSLKWILEARLSNPDANIGPPDITERVSMRLGPPMWAWNPLGLDIEDVIGDCLSDAMEYTQEQQDLSDELLLARYMLIGLGMLDIDEVVEYREPFLPSQNGPPRFQARKDNETGSIEISNMECDVCKKPLRGMAWVCRAGCQAISVAPGVIPGPFMICMPCYHDGEHPKQHLIRWPHSYAITPSLQAELSPDDFWRVRREIQRQQASLDAEQDNAQEGLMKSTLIQSIAPVSRSFFPLGNVHASLMFGPLIFEIGVPE
jgi:hypothetical protein